MPNKYGPLTEFLRNAQEVEVVLDLATVDNMVGSRPAAAVKAKTFLRAVSAF
jgi:hypothetical protein